MQAHAATAPADTTGRSVLIVRRGSGLIAVPRRRRDALLSRLWTYWLDGRLAAGVAPEAGRFLAVRAGQLTGTRMRHRVARRWDEVAVRARSQHSDATADQIQSVADLLRSNRPVSAHGVATASVLLGTSANPASRLDCGGVDIAAAVARTLAAPVG